MYRRSVPLGIAAMAAAVFLSGNLAIASPMAADGAKDVVTTEVPPAGVLEKARAVTAIGEEITGEWTSLDDKAFVFRVYDRADPARYPLTKAEAYRVYKLEVADASAFIRTGIHEFVDRDHDEKIRRDHELELARKAREDAARWAGITADAAMLDGTDQNFVYQVWKRASGPKVKNGALEAWGGDEAGWKTFITTTIYDLHTQDQLDAIARERERDEEAAKKLESDFARTNAVNAVPIPPNPAWLALADDDFIRELLKTTQLADPVHAEVKSAALAALQSSDRLVWRAYIDRGVHDAVKRDGAREQAARDEADRQKVRDIRAKAETSRLRPRLVQAADAALRGTPADVTAFLREGQFLPLTQSLMATSQGRRGFYVTGNVSGEGTIGTGDNPNRPTGTRPFPAANWRVVTGLADAGCYSLESTRQVGTYLRQRELAVKVQGNDGTDQFKLDATWCPKPVSAHVALESKAQPGRFLRHFQNKLWVAARTGSNAFDGGPSFMDDIAWTARQPDPEITTVLMLRWYNDAAAAAAVGAPTASEVFEGYDGNGFRYRDFANGRMYQHDRLGPAPRWMGSPFVVRYVAFGGLRFSFPETDQETLPDGAHRVKFRNGASLYRGDKSIEPKLVYGAIQDKWIAEGGGTGYLGYPINDEYAVENGRRSDFQGGWILHYPATGQTVAYRR
ncbi:AbfB domain-containing protein [Amycolatopsis umgeniensis]|uniref:Alpha-L-arabinofuranosidase B arabinose-binding domain-containing protein n=1 Tax=Amycolatopsis umgeniensis TaxID=336628 RepID=A0A841ARW3_9PSEU|nr:AbfB domain-containing protein [Amycolatopsis umgeniensis]MBB5851579.1 hypothetical protein [Amycolatopsis umgeniensis]